MTKRTTQLRSGGTPQRREIKLPAKKGRKPPPAGETARERFLRIGQPRVANAVRDIRLIGNLARGAYEWTDRDVALIQSTLYRAVDDMVKDFAAVKATVAPDKTPVRFDFERGLLEPTTRR